MTQLTNEAIEARREYQRKWYNNLPPEKKKTRYETLKKWRKKNPERVKAINSRYWNKKAKERKGI